MDHDCKDVSFRGFRLFQYQNIEDHKWYVVYELQTRMVDINGVEIQRGNPMQTRTILSKGERELSLKEVFKLIAGLRPRIIKSFIKEKVCLAGKGKEQLFADGFSEEEIGDICDG